MQGQKFVSLETFTGHKESRTGVDGGRRTHFSLPPDGRIGCFSVFMERRDICVAWTQPLIRRVKEPCVTRRNPIPEKWSPDDTSPRLAYSTRSLHTWQNLIQD
ncbi:hypothetical protein D8B26_000723 [Coccidioides posadasii str. Silveira]|uniref:Uncharacterized protein n=2 Tax=Coccidioides TaxID=5500 RepID=E9CSG7_COCPS|nr:conserved hypothetical protein [Coccidioides posadasii str. Silveira]QVM06013.1 hypothetical protein D8B26_000723 [Coccidioides posadasii str. Silveira]